MAVSSPGLPVRSGPLDDVLPFPIGLSSARLIVARLHPGWMERLEARFGPVERSSFAAWAVVAHADEVLAECWDAYGLDQAEVLLA